MIYHDYNDSIVNLANSILKYFDEKTFHNSISDVDEFLNKENPKNVIVILYDGMGYNLVNRILNEDSFIRNNMIRSISSVCPTTTTASTTSMLTGLNPVEHGWLGWDLLIPPYKKIVSMFKNRLKDTDILVEEYNVASKYYPIETLDEIINKSKKFTSSILFPFKYRNSLVFSNLDDMMNKIIKESNKEGKKFVYAYYENPDAIMHETGTDSTETKVTFELINKKTEELCSKIHDSVVIVVADHGHVNSDTLLISNYPDFNNTLDGDVWIEPRFCSFKVKDEVNFLKLFDKYFSKDFILKTKEEIINEKIFGDGIENKYFKDSLGDYFALAISNKCIVYSENSNIFISNHAGLTEDEMRIPLIMRKCK